MITEETVWNDIWPVVERAIEATLAEDSSTLRGLLLPDRQASRLLNLFGPQVFDILLKTVLGHGALGLTRAVETEANSGETATAVYIEYAWPDPDAADNSYTPTDVVTVRLAQQENGWLITDINPASIDIPLTTARARHFLASTQDLSEDAKVPAEPWILPFALYAGMLQIPLAETAVADPVEQQLLSGLKQRTFGIIPLVHAQTLWRDYKTSANPKIDNPNGWAAAVEYIIHEQQQRPVTQAAVGKQYQVNLSTLVPRIKRIKKTLTITDTDSRYSDLPFEQVVFAKN